MFQEVFFFIFQGSYRKNFQCCLSFFACKYTFLKLLYQCYLLFIKSVKTFSNNFEAIVYISRSEATKEKKQTRQKQHLEIATTPSK